MNTIPFAVLAMALSATTGEALELHSPDIGEQKTIPMKHVYNGFGCTGENVSPALQWSGVPDGTKSFALTVHDPDAPTDHGWWHWLIFNIPADVRELKTGAGDPKAGIAPAGAIQSRTDFKANGYGGPCPPTGHGIHHYNFRLYALDVENVPLKADASPAEVDAYLRQHSLEQAQLTGLFSR